MKTAVIYYSAHHGNTKKVLDAIARRFHITLIDAVKTDTADLAGYDLIGFASGIYYSKFHKCVLQFAERNLPAGKKVFFLYTCGVEKKGTPRPSQKPSKTKRPSFWGNTAVWASTPSAPSNSSAASPRDGPMRRISTMWSGSTQTSLQRRIRENHMAEPRGISRGALFRDLPVFQPSDTALLSCVASAFSLECRPFPINFSLPESQTFRQAVRWVQTDGSGKNFPVSAMFPGRDDSRSRFPAYSPSIPASAGG